MSGPSLKIGRAITVAAVLALPFTVAIAGQVVPASTVLSEITINLAGDARIGSVRSGMLCTPNGKLSWHQIAMPTDKAIKEAVAARLVAADNAGAGSTSRVLGLSIDGADIKVCTAWMGMGNAPKGKGNLTLTWRDLDAHAGGRRPVTMSQDLAFDHRDPRVDPAVVCDAIATAAVRYVQTTTGR